LLDVAPVLGQAITDPTKPSPPSATTAKPNQGPPSPFTLTAAYTADLLGDVSGGTRTGDGYVHLIKLSAAYDGASVGQEGLTGLVSVVDVSGSGFTARNVGGVQNVSALEALPGGLRVYEAWLQGDISHGLAGIKGGFIDINTTFDVQETGALFLNASHGIGPEISDTGLNGPSGFPRPALGMTAFYRPIEDWTAQLGVFDGVAGDPAHKAAFVAVNLDGALIIGQVEKRFGDVARVEVGAWTYTAAFPSLDQFGGDGGPRPVHSNDGVYGLVEGRLMAEPDDNEAGLSGWLRLGAANGDINDVANYVGAGLVYTGLIEGRDKDEIGAAIARVGFGADARYSEMVAGRRIGDAETDLEATYRYAFKDWLNIQPDVQYVISPHGDAHISNAVVIGLRLAFTYSQ
jgi:porin